MTDLGLILTQIQQKNIRVIQAIRGKKISHKLSQITTNNPPTENTNLIHLNPICTNFNYKGIWVKECR